VIALPAAAQNLPQVKTVFVIAMENHNFTQPSPTSSPQQILNNTARLRTSTVSLHRAIQTRHRFRTAPIITTRALAVHPSEPNYIWAEAGTDFGDHVTVIQLWLGQHFHRAGISRAS